MSANMKKCTKCLIEKTLDNFYVKRHRNGKDYLNSNCKECWDKQSVEYNRTYSKRKELSKRSGERRKERLKTDLEYANRIREQKREYHRKDARGSMLLAAKARALKKGLEFSITKNNITIPEMCPILGVPIVVGTKDSYEQSPSLDRIDNTRGYTIDNVQVISKKANSMKNSGTPEELIKLADWIYKTFSQNIGLNN